MYYKRPASFDVFVIDCNLDMLCREIATIRPVSRDDGKGEVYNLAFNDSNYVSTLIQYSLEQVSI